MSPTLSAQQNKAKQGLRLIEEAIVELVQERPGSKGEEIDEALGLPMNSPSGFKGIFGMIVRQGMESVEKRKDGRWYLRGS
jgi:hypothetical protein